MDDVAYQSVYRINWLALHEYNSIGGLALGLLVERREDVLDLPAPLTLGDAIQLRGAVISKREHCSIKHVCHVPSCKTRRYQWLQWQPRPNGWMYDGSGVRYARTRRDGHRSSTRIRYLGDAYMVVLDGNVDDEHGRVALGRPRIEIYRERHAMP